MGAKRPQIQHKFPQIACHLSFSLGMAAMFGVSAITIASCKMHYIPPNIAMMPIFESRLFP